MSQYDAFAADFARTRTRPWAFLVAVLQELTEQGLLKQYELGIDIGCGTGQNASLLQNRTQMYIGIDISWKLLQLARMKYSQLIQADLQAMPFRDESFDVGVCVAVLHHLMGRESRQISVSEMKRIIILGGHVIVTTWRRWQARFRKFFLHDGFSNATLYVPAGTKDFGDVEVGWKDSKLQIVHPREYHLFTVAELRDLLKGFQILQFKVTGHKNSKTNYVVLVQRPS